MSRVTNLAVIMEQVLGGKLEELAARHGVIRRRRKFTGQSLVRMLVFALLQKPDATFTDLALMASQLGVPVSATAVEKRMTPPLVDFLRAVCERMCAQVFAAEPVEIALFNRFTAVFIGDSSTVMLPDEMRELFPGCGGSHGASQAALKLQVRFDLKTGALPQVVIEAGKASDARSAIAQQPSQPGALEIFDLGDFGLARFRRVDQSKAFFLSRLQQGTAVLTEAGEVVDLRRFLPSQAQAGVVDMPVLLGVGERLHARLIAIRVPEDSANQRRQKAREKSCAKGRDISAEYSELLGWNLFVTNAPQDLLSWQDVVVLYRARWQIELLFKLWKSHNHLAHCRPGASVSEVMTVLWARLIGVLLQHWLLLTCCWHDERRSLTRAARVIRDWITVIASVLDHRTRLISAISQLKDHLTHITRIQCRRRKPSHFQLLNNPLLLNWNP